MVNALVISTNERQPNVSHDGVYDPGFGFLNKRVSVSIGVADQSMGKVRKVR